MSVKSDILAAVAIPRGTTEIGGVEVGIRGLSAAEEIKFSEDGFTANAVAICAACIGDDDKPMFSAKELQDISAGVLKDALMDILKISFPKDVEKN